MSEPVPVVITGNGQRFETLTTVTYQARQLVDGTSLEGWAGSCQLTEEIQNQLDPDTDYQVEVGGPTPLVGELLSSLPELGLVWVGKPSEADTPSE